MTTYETDNWLYVPARDIGPKRDGPVRVITLHTAETPEKDNAAENLAKYFQHPDYTSSCHVCTSNKTVIQCVKDSYVAYAAPGVNNDGIQIEMCCYMNQTASEWRDFYSLGLLAITADVVAQYCLKYDIPAQRLLNAQLAAGQKGIIGHVQASEVYKKSDHTDPGPNFPWQRFIPMVQGLITERRLIV